MLRFSVSQPEPGAKHCTTCVLESLESTSWPIRPRPEMLPCSFGALPGANPILYFFQVSKLPVGPFDPGLKCFAAAAALCQAQIFSNPLFLEGFETACWPV